MSSESENPTGDIKAEGQGAALLPCNSFWLLPGSGEDGVKYIVKDQTEKPVFWVLDANHGNPSTLTSLVIKDADHLDILKISRSGDEPIITLHDASDNLIGSVLISTKAIKEHKKDKDGKNKEAKRQTIFQNSMAQPLFGLTGKNPNGKMLKIKSLKCEAIAEDPSHSEKKEKDKNDADKEKTKIDNTDQKSKDKAEKREEDKLKKTRTDKDATDKLEKDKKDKKDKDKGDKETKEKKSTEHGGDKKDKVEKETKEKKGSEHGGDKKEKDKSEKENKDKHKADKKGDGDSENDTEENSKYKEGKTGMCKKDKSKKEKNKKNITGKVTGSITTGLHVVLNQTDITFSKRMNAIALLISHLELGKPQT